MHENDRNPCKEMNCPGLCCSNLRGQYKAPEDWFKMAFPESNNVHTMDNLVEFQRQKISGVYHVAHGNYVQVLINGNCPNLSKEGLCEIHQEPYFPKMCENALPGSEECKTVRRIRKLKA